MLDDYDDDTEEEEEEEGDEDKEEEEGADPSNGRNKTLGASQDIHS